MSLGTKAARGTFWVAGGTYVNQLINFFANILLMRLLAPEHFGVLALVMFFLVLGQKLVWFGFNHALIHRTEDLDRAVPTHQLLNLISSLLVVVLVYLSGNIFRSHYDDLTATVLLVLAASGVLLWAGNTPRIMLEKELDFAPLAKVNVAATLASDIIAVGLALFGFGIWALVVRQIISDGVSTLGYFAVSKRKFRIRFDWEMIRWYLRFGAYLWIAGMATLVVLKFDDYLVGTLVSIKELGYYARAYVFACLPTTMIAHVVAKVAFPLYSKVQHDKEKLSEVFSFAIRGILMMTLPLAVGMAICADEFVVLLFGEKWAPMAPLLQLLLIYASFRPLFDNTGELFTAIGKPKISGWIQMAQAAGVLVFCPVMTWLWGAPGAAVAVGLAMAAGVILAYRQIPRYVNINIMANFAGIVGASCVGAFGVWFAGLFYSVDSMVARFFAKGALFLLVFVVALLILDGRRVISDAKQFLKMTGIVAGEST